jgi:hypothetical protein
MSLHGQLPWNKMYAAWPVIKAHYDARVGWWRIQEETAIE